MKFHLMLATLISCLTLASATSADTKISLGTTGINRGYFTAQAICILVMKAKIRCDVESGSTALNMKALRAGTLNFVIMRSDVLREAREGTSQFVETNFEQIRSVFALFLAQPATSGLVTPETEELKFVLATTASTPDPCRQGSCQ